MSGFRSKCNVRLSVRHLSLSWLWRSGNPASCGISKRGGKVCHSSQAQLLRQPAKSSVFELMPCYRMLHHDAEVAELADAQDLGSCDRKAVGVQIPPSALTSFGRPVKVATTALLQGFLRLGGGHKRSHRDTRERFMATGWQQSEKWRGKPLSRRGNSSSNRS